MFSMKSGTERPPSLRLFTGWCRLGQCDPGTAREGGSATRYFGRNDQLGFKVMRHEQLSYHSYILLVVYLFL